jgi:hypothetical protein
VFKEQKKCPSCGQLKYTRLKESEIDEIKVLSTSKQIADFMTTTLYQDYKSELEICLFEFDQLLDDPQLEYTGRHYDLFRGAKYALTQSLNLFDRLLGNRQADDDNEEVTE